MRLVTVLLALSLCAPARLPTWGSKGHEIAAAAALRDLPAVLAPRFQGQEETLAAHVNDPDRWRESDPNEGPRHYLDSEPYGGPDAVPRDIQAARAQLGEDEFQRDGQVPWVIQDRVRDLAGAFQGGDPDQAAFQAAILCHYVGDLCVPLHTTENHDGEQTGQKGVHHRWESGLVSRLGDWQPEARTPVLGPDPLLAPWAWLRDSYALVATVLSDDAAASNAGAGAWAGAAPELERESRYWQVFERLEEPRVKEQLTLAGQRTAQMILLAWNLAGQPERARSGHAED
ncbi:MAG: S1/P1 nuclease [Holophaga sp.]|jgi:hypothetical protein